MLLLGTSDTLMQHYKLFYFSKGPSSICIYLTFDDANIRVCHIQSLLLPLKIFPCVYAVKPCLVIPIQDDTYWREILITASVSKVFATPSSSSIHCISLGIREPGDLRSIEETVLENFHPARLRSVCSISKCF